jgi:hypothetical protein
MKLYKPFFKPRVTGYDGVIAFGGGAENKTENRKRGWK